jgi:hypothetical protein
LKGVVRGIDGFFGYDDDNIDSYTTWSTEADGEEGKDGSPDKDGEGKDGEKTEHHDAAHHHHHDKGDGKGGKGKGGEGHPGEEHPHPEHHDWKPSNVEQLINSNAVNQMFRGIMEAGELVVVIDITIAVGNDIVVVAVIHFLSGRIETGEIAVICTI